MAQREAQILFGHLTAPVTARQSCWARTTVDQMHYGISGHVLNRHRARGQRVMATGRRVHIMAPKKRQEN